MIGFPPHEFLPHQFSSVAVSVMCRTCNLMVGVQYQSILNFFFFFNFVFSFFLSNFFKGLLNTKENKRVRGAPKGGLRTQETRLVTALIKFRNKTNERTDLHQFRKEPSYDGDVCPCEV